MFLVVVIRGGVVWFSGKVGLLGGGLGVVFFNFRAVIGLGGILIYLVLSFYRRN